MNDKTKKPVVVIVGRGTPSDKMQKVRSQINKTRNIAKAEAERTKAQQRKNKRVFAPKFDKREAIKQEQIEHGAKVTSMPDDASRSLLARWIANRDKKAVERGIKGREYA